MAATGRRTVAPGQNIASDWGNVVWDQSVQWFDTAAQRATQYPSPHEGAMSFIDDTKRLEKYSGGGWILAAPTITFNGSPIRSPIIYATTVAVSTDAGGGAQVPISPPFPGIFSTVSITDSTAGIGPVFFKADFANSAQSVLKIFAFGAGGGALPGYSVTPSILIIGN